MAKTGMCILWTWFNVYIIDFIMYLCIIMYRKEFCLEILFSFIVLLWVESKPLLCILLTNIHMFCFFQRKLNL